MAEQVTIQAQSRTTLGKKVKALRRAGITPIHVYGHGQASLSLQANTYDLVRTIQEVGHTTPVTVTVDGQEHFAMVNHVQRHPVTEMLLHVDLIRVSRTERITASIPLHLEGEARGAREEGAQLYEDLREVDVEALPMDLPHSITVDLTPLDDVGKAIHARDLALPSRVTLMTDPDAVVARIIHRGPEIEEEEEEAAEEEAAEEAKAVEEQEEKGEEKEEE